MPLQKDSNSPQAASGGCAMRWWVQSTQRVPPVPASGSARAGVGVCGGEAGGGGAEAAEKERAAETHTGAGCLFSHSVWNESPFIPASEVSSAGPLVQSECLQ